MVDKNPYENDDVDVPNFGETEEKGADPIFNMDTTSVTPETDAYTTEEEAESSSKVAIVVLIVFLVLFLVGTISGWLFGISKSNEVNTKNTINTTIATLLEDSASSSVVYASVSGTTPVVSILNIGSAPFSSVSPKLGTIYAYHPFRHPCLDLSFRRPYRQTY